jgi:hypothetical protein
MARIKNIGNTPSTVLLEVPADSDLPLRIAKISEETGLDPLDLFRKWVLQEESLIGLMQPRKVPTPAQLGILPNASPQQNSDVQEREEPAKIDANSPKYRKGIVKRIKKLRKEGMTIVKIAEIFNEENLPTVSGKGKWYSSSISWLFNSNT